MYLQYCCCCSFPKLITSSTLIKVLYQIIIMQSYYKLLLDIRCSNKLVPTFYALSFKQVVFCFCFQNSSSWLIPILSDMLRHIFQFCVLESNQEILDLIHKVQNEYICSSLFSNLVDYYKFSKYLYIHDGTLEAIRDL